MSLCCKLLKVMHSKDYNHDWAWWEQWKVTCWNSFLTPWTVKSELGDGDKDDGNANEDDGR